MNISIWCVYISAIVDFDGDETSNGRRDIKISGADKSVHKRSLKIYWTVRGLHSGDTLATFC
jgi:hypothetical protein